jgi:uncharacterized protein (TIGR02217 family)
MSFLETPRFPDDIAYGSQGGPGYSTSIIVIRSGYESRNVNWTYPKHSYDVAYGVRSIDQLESLIDYFHAVGGMGYGFRYKDFADFKSCHTGSTPAATDQLLGTGNASTPTFQIKKIYEKGAFSRTRLIKKPVSGTVLVSIDDVAIEDDDETYPWSVDTTTGIITFSSNPPPNGDDVKAGFQFDVPVRFDTDQLMVNYEAYEQGTANVPLIEIRDTS